MKNQQDNIWTGVEDLTNDSAHLQAAEQEFVGLPIIEAASDENIGNRLETNRRDFLKYLGFSVGAATIAASCEIPVKKAIPYVSKPDSIVPGIANYYASSFVNGGDYCAILVKTREGRPIKIEGNDMSQVTKGGTSARVQAMVLSLYDTARIRHAGSIKSETVTKIAWADLDSAIKSKLAGANIRIITNTILSPTTKKVLAEFTAKYPNTKVVTYDPVSSSAILLANEKSFGDKTIPNYKFENADYIVGFNCDFLGTWISPIEYARAYAKNRTISDVKTAKISRHVHVESNMSLTGSNADNRILVKPSEQGAAIATLYNEVAALMGGTTVSAPAVNAKAAAALKKLAAELATNKGKCLVVSGSNNVGEQILINGINAMLGSYGNTIDFGEASNQRQGIDADLQNLVTEMSNGSVNAVIVIGANPAFDAPNAGKFIEGFKKVATKISLNTIVDETTALCDYAAPSHHALESWGDAEPKRGHFSLMQPTIAPLFETRQAEQTLLTWCESANLQTTAEQPYYEYLKANWQSTQFGKQKEYNTFQSFWNATLHDGVMTTPTVAKAGSFNASSVATAAADITKPSGAKVEIGIYEPVNIGNGQYADNPWLQEMPDPVSRTCWGNYLTIPLTFDGDNDYKAFNDLEDGDLVKVKVNGKEIELPVVRQFGQMQGTVGIAMGYGRMKAGRGGQDVGKNINSWISVNNNGTAQYFGDATVSNKTGVEKDFACVQKHHTIGVTGKLNGSKETINVDERILGYKGFQGSLTKRTVLRQSHVKDIEKFTLDLVKEREHHQYLNKQTLYPDLGGFYGKGHHWGLHIDLNACTGCGACTVACMAENNVPVVGKKEVARVHEMSWLRIDRYYYGDVNNPNTVYQPMMCQHCDNAPCENVCPVAATNHSSEGLNQMTYNRCIGTRYCANNCPFKVRRFNWLDYTTADLFGKNEPAFNGGDLPIYADNLTRMVLNPDVTVRSRGVIEKCSFCVQRIQEGKLTAKREGRTLRDSDVKSACMTACPTGAIVFGDVNNKDTEVSKRNQSPLNYIALEEINVAPGVHYASKIHNRSEGIEA
ncbi:MAG: TAT-variant-translocated molybdopterin oxidoreductase [Saprospiraceae bacterium]|nr:TAT-variant-translocated molybdopterin oxidoreductase [Saprospiraceae bacterium]MBP7699373.1 TAT-variant-translocated molybdopterin oxidoreductase [Saprospiraceae bacterium]